MKRSEVQENRRWRTEDLFATRKEWEDLFAAVAEKLDFSAYRGKLHEKETLLACLAEMGAVTPDLNRLGLYAFLRHDEDTRVSDYTALSSRVDTLALRLSENTAFILPELTAQPADYLTDCIGDPRFSEYDYTLRGVLRQKPHILSQDCETLLSQGGKVFGAFRDIFGMFDDADFPAPTVKIGGRAQKITHGAYSLLLRSPDRAVRKKVFSAYYKAYTGHIHTLAAIYAGNVEKDVFLSRARKYDSCLARALDGEDVPAAVYENLLRGVEEGLPLLHRYMEVRKKILGLPKMHMYDLHTPIVPDAEMKLDYEDAFALVREGLSPLGEDYAALLTRAHDGGWIDVEETEGKRSGAYSASVFGAPHPYVLLNYQKTTGDIFTLAHELGHALHSYYSESAQPQEKADYRIFVAEVASTVNEVLLLRHLLRTATDKDLKKYLLSYYMDTLKSTLFRQTQFAEFEYRAHKMAEEGEPLTEEALSSAYLAINRRYYGPAVESDREIAYEWARIPHFYRAFYVYKYATGITAAVTIADRIEKEGAAAVADYKKFLSSGGSDSPCKLLQLAGVDLTEERPYKTVMQSFSAALTAFEAL